MLTEFVKLGENKFRYDKCRVEKAEDVVRAMEAGYLFGNISYPEWQEERLARHARAEMLCNRYAALAYAYCCLNGIGMEKKQEIGVRLLKKLSADGDVAAQLNLGVCYDKGEGVYKNHTEAKQWWRKAAAAGNATAAEYLRKYF